MWWWYGIKKARREEKAAAREKEISVMLQKIETLNNQTRGGLRSCPRAEKDENQETVNKAWEGFIAKRIRNKSGRF